MEKLEGQVAVATGATSGIGRAPVPPVPADIADSALYVLMQPRRIRIPRLMILPADNVI